METGLRAPENRDILHKSGHLATLVTILMFFNYLYNCQMKRQHKSTNKNVNVKNGADSCFEASKVAMIKSTKNECIKS